MDEKKPVLPFGWVVRQSKTYPDRIYYFNINTGASSWEFPDLLQHYVSGQANTTVAPVLSATSFTVDTISPEKSPVPTTSTQHLSHQPNRHKVATSSRIKGHATSTSNDNESSIKLPSRQVASAGISQSLPDNQRRHTTKPHTLSQLMCSQRAPALDRGKSSKLKSGTVDNQLKSQHQPCPTSNVKKGCKYADSALKNVSSVKNDLQSNKNVTVQSRQGHPYKRDSSTDKGSLGKSLQRYVKGSSQTSSKSQQSLTSKSSHLPSAKLSVAKNESNSGINKKGSNMKYPEKNADQTKRMGCNVSSSVQKNKAYSNSMMKDSRNVVDMGKHVSENINKRNVKRPMSHDSQTVKRQKTGSEVQCRSVDKFNKKEVRSEETESTNKKQSKVKYEDSSQDTCIQVETDKRKVVRSAQSHSNLTNNMATPSTKKLTPSNYDASVNKSVPIVSPCEERAPESDVGSDYDPNNNTEYKLFIGDKEKLLSIQSWINNLQDRAGSESPSGVSYSQASLTQVNESVDSGYVTNTTIKTCSPPEKGQPVEMKESEAALKQVIDMEVEFFSDEKLPVGRDGEGMWRVGDGVSGEVERQPSGETEELMDIDEVLVEVRQQMIGSGDQNAGSFLTYTDQFTPMKASKQIITVVVDTNILISNLGLFEMLKDYQLQSKSQAKLCLYIPWIVLRELDVLKEKVSANKQNMYEAQSKARAAISVLKTLFSSKHPRVKGQTPKEADEASDNFRSSCNDDDILQACLQCQKNGLYVVLLTNDNNLINKALVSNISAYNANDILSGLNEADNKFPFVTSANPANVEDVFPAISKHKGPPSIKSAGGTGNTSCINEGKSVRVKQEVIPQSAKPKQTCLADKILKEEKTSTVETLVDDMYCKMKAVLHEALGKILEVEMQKAYDDIWTDIVYRKPPWDLKAILECWKKHWIAVFGLVFPRYLSRNVDNLLSNICRHRHKSVYLVKDICKDVSEILENAVLSSTYSSRISDISKTVALMRDLCDKLPGMTSASVPDLEQYLNSQDNMAVNDAGSTSRSNPSTGPTSQCTSAKSVIYARQPPPATHTSNTNPHSQSSTCDSNQKTLQSGSVSSQPLQSGSLSCQPLQNGSQINLVVSSNDFDKTVTDVAQSDNNSELMAGEYISNIWRCIYRYCDEFYRTIGASEDQGVLRDIEPVLKVLVSTCLELRKFYAGLLELPVSDLSNREEEFTALSQIFSSFFSKLNVQENVPDGSVTPLQLLVLYSKPIYRETLTQFLSKLDEMLKMMYQCLHKLCPDD